MTRLFAFTKKCRRNQFSNSLNSTAAPSSVPSTTPIFHAGGEMSEINWKHYGECRGVVCRQLPLKILIFGAVCFVVIIRSVEFVDLSNAATTASPLSDYNSSQCDVHYPDTPTQTSWFERKKKYVKLKDYVSCARLGNLLYREVSLYAFGRQLGRERFMDMEEKRSCPGLFDELLKDLPVVEQSITFADAPELSWAIVNTTGDNGAEGETLEEMSKCNEADMLILDGAYFQSYTNFHQMKADVRSFVSFSAEVERKVEEEGKRLFGDDQSHKFCIHARRTDFLRSAASFLEPSRLDFVIPATEFILRRLHEELDGKNVTKKKQKERRRHWADPRTLSDVVKEYYKDEISTTTTTNQIPEEPKLKPNRLNISLVLFSDDQEHFARLIRPDPQLYNGRYLIPDQMSASVVLRFANRFCDSFLLSSSASTFGWWMAYLMDEEKQHRIFYNIKPSTLPTYGAYKFDSKTFPPEWQRLRLNADGMVEMEKRWLSELERDGVPVY